MNKLIPLLCALSFGLVLTGCPPIDDPESDPCDPDPAPQMPCGPDDPVSCCAESNADPQFDPQPQPWVSPDDQ